MLEKVEKGWVAVDRATGRMIYARGCWLFPEYSLTNDPRKVNLFASSSSAENGIQDYNKHHKHKITFEIRKVAREVTVGAWVREVIKDFQAQIAEGKVLALKDVYKNSSLSKINAYWAALRFVTSHKVDRPASILRANKYQFSIAFSFWEGSRYFYGYITKDKCYVIPMG